MPGPLPQSRDGRSAAGAECGGQTAADPGDGDVCSSASVDGNRGCDLLLLFRRAAECGSPLRRAPRAAHGQEHREAVRFEVGDHGCGMSPADAINGNSAKEAVGAGAGLRETCEIVWKPSTAGLRSIRCPAGAPSSEVGSLCRVAASSAAIQRAGLSVIPRSAERHLPDTCSAAPTGAVHRTRRQVTEVAEERLRPGGELLSDLELLEVVQDESWQGNPANQFESRRHVCQHRPSPADQPEHGEDARHHRQEQDAEDHQGPASMRQIASASRRKQLRSIEAVVCHGPTLWSRPDTGGTRPPQRPSQALTSRGAGNFRVAKWGI